MIKKLLGITVVLSVYFLLVLLTEISKRINKVESINKNEMFKASMNLDKGQRRKFHGKKH